MSYIYKSDGSLIKTNNIIEHLDICFGALCVTNERDIPEKQKELKCPDQKEPEQCKPCTVCDTLQCPIPKACPVCADLKEQNKKVSSVISEPYIIIQQMTVNNLLAILDEYLEKLERYTINATKKYILYSDIKDIINLLEGNKNLDMNYTYEKDLNQELNEYADFDKVEYIKNLLKNKNVMNIPNITNVYSAFKINASFKPNVIESFTDFYSTQGLFKKTIIESFVSKFDIYGNFDLHLIDLEIDNNQTYRYLLISLTDEQKISLNNALIYNIPIEVPTNNIAPNTYDAEDVLTFGKTFLQALFVKPDPENYIYFENENTKSNVDIIKNNIDNIEYKEEDTNITINYINQNKEFIKRFNNFIKTHNFGEVIDINKLFIFTINVNNNEYKFYIMDLKLSDFKIYRFLTI